VCLSFILLRGFMIPLRTGVAVVAITIITATVAAASEHAAERSIAQPVNRLRPGIAVTFCPSASVTPSFHSRVFDAVVSSLPQILRRRTSLLQGVTAGATIVLAHRGLKRASGVCDAGHWGIFRVQQPIRAAQRTVGRMLARMQSSEDHEKRARTAFRKSPSVVTWHQPRVFLQGLKKELLLQAWVTSDTAAPSAPATSSGAGADSNSSAQLAILEQDGKALWTGLGCNETEFRLLLAHVCGNSTEAEHANVSELYVNLNDQSIREDLRHRWTARRLVLKDKSLKKSMASDQSLVGDVKGYLTRMDDFEKEACSGPHLLSWLRTSWPHAAAGGAAGAGDAASDGVAASGGVAELMFTEDRGIEETGQALQPMLEWFRSAYPYYHQRCFACASDATTRLGTLRSNAAEEYFAAGRTEIYHCGGCGTFSRFARYNQVGKVLEGGRGRCGEYSMVFYHLMRALGYPTRWVVDWTDHVWVEVLVGGCWVHIDPCEAAFNDKGMYIGWGKKHTYVVAFERAGGQQLEDKDEQSTVEFEDVTMDYADDMSAVRLPLASLPHPLPPRSRLALPRPCRMPPALAPALPVPFAAPSLLHLSSRYLLLP